jgi:hypothetical protein
MPDLTPVKEPWPGEMTDRQRFNAQMHHQPFDRCFNMEFGYWEEVFSEWPLFIERGITTHDEGHRVFGLDRWGQVGGCVWMQPAFERKVLRETATSQIIQDPNGLTAELPKDDHSTIPHFTDSAVKTPDDWKKVKDERFHLDDPARTVDVEAIRQAHPDDRDYPLAVVCGSMIGKIRDMLTFEGLAYACFDYPDMVEDMVETSCRLVEHFLDQILGKVQFDYAHGWEDICFKNGPIVTVDFYEKVVTPRYQRISKKLREHGIDLWSIDCDGDIRPIIHCFLEGGVNTMFPFEVNGSGHPGEVLDKYGPELRVMGGVDKTQMARGGDVLKEYMESLAPHVQKGGFIPFCDHRCPPDVSQENYFYYMDLKRELFCGR